MTEIKGDLLKKYVDKIKTFESNLAIIHKKDSKHKGYIINLNDYNKLKEKIEYEKNKKITISSKIDIKDDEKIMTIKDIEFRTAEYLTNMLLNGNKYIIIDGAFWKAIREKGKESSTVINYEIAGSTALLNLKLKGDK